MRVWDIDPPLLCRQHLLGEHREIHAVWAIITKRKRGYARHPETRRWKGKLAALHARHEAVAAEMRRRGYRHASPLDEALATGHPVQDVFIDAPVAQLAILRAKDCLCPQEPE